MKSYDSDPQLPRNIKSLKCYFSGYTKKHRGKFIINAVGLREQMNPVIIKRPQGTNSWLFMIFYDKVQIGRSSEKDKTAQNSFIYWKSGSEHLYGNPDREWRHSWFHCDGTVVKKMMENFPLKPATPIYISTSHFFDQYLMDIYEELTSYSFPDTEIQISLFRVLLHKLMRGMNKCTSRKIPEGIQRARLFMDSNYRSKLTLHKLAQTAAMSPLTSVRNSNHTLVGPP